eukprot:1160249-Pelagomonas_calceolata.AAC.8
MKIGRARVICTAQIRAENGNNITKEDEVWCVNMKGDEGWGSRGYMYKRRRQNWQGRGAGQVWKEPKCMPHKDTDCADTWHVYEQPCRMHEASLMRFDAGVDGTHALHRKAAVGITQEGDR